MLSLGAIGRNNILSKCPSSSWTISSSFVSGSGPKKSPVHKSKSNLPCLASMALTLANSSRMEPTTEPTVNLVKNTRWNRPFSQVLPHIFIEEVAIVTKSYWHVPAVSIPLTKQYMLWTVTIISKLSADLHLNYIGMPSSCKQSNHLQDAQLIRAICIRVIDLVVPMQ